MIDHDLTYEEVLAKLLSFLGLPCYVRVQTTDGLIVCEFLGNLARGRRHPGLEMGGRDEVLVFSFQDASRDDFIIYKSRFEQAFYHESTPTDEEDLRPTLRAATVDQGGVRIGVTQNPELAEEIARSRG